MINEQYPVQMVNFVLETNGFKIFGLYFNRISIPVQALHRYTRRPVNVSGIVNDAEASLFSRDQPFF